MSANIDITWNGDMVIDALKDKLSGTLLEIAEDLKSKSIAEVPVDSGELRDNCKVDTSNIENLEVKVGYDAPHALAQHEKIELQHLSGGKAKFLEDPFNQNKAQYKSMIAESISEVRL